MIEQQKPIKTKIAPAGARFTSSDWLADGVLFINFIQGDVHCHSNPLAIGWIGLHTVADMPDFDIPWGITHGTGGVPKENLLLFCTH